MSRTVRTDGAFVLDPGYLRDQITWQQRTVTGQNSFGEDAYGWTNVLTGKARIEELQGDELLRAQQYFALAKYEIIQHHSSGLDTSMRIAWFIDGEMLFLNVLNIKPSPGMRLYQTVLAKDYEGPAGTTAE